jgi:ribonucleoside-diphosphate reductase beta chain
VPFGLTPVDFSDFAISQFQKRLERLERARGASLEEIDRVTMAVIDRDDG